MRYAWLILSILALTALAQTGCVERRYVIVTDPPGAVVERNGQLLGATPVDDHFVYYGKYQFKIVKPGYETLQVVQDIPPPWYEYLGIDFLSENIWPFTIIDRREFHYQLPPVMQPQINDMLREAENLRNRGKSIQPPPGSAAAVGAVQPAVVPAQPPVAPPPSAPTLQPPVGAGPPRAGQPPPGAGPQQVVTPTPAGAPAAVTQPPPTLQPQR
jgi:hypothetical protein